MRKKFTLFQLLSLSFLLSLPSAKALLIEFEASDFGLNPTFSSVTTFAFSIDLAGTIVPGGSYNNPTLNGVNYNVFGTLDATPSGFPAFNLVRVIGGAEFYTQGSSTTFDVSPTADLSDGLQVSELVGTDPVFVFNGREVGTGRYHPSLFELNADGTGLMRNSNNFGGINPGSMMMVDVEIGEEYITELTFDPSTLSLTDAIAPIPEPNTLIPAGLLLMAVCRYTRKRG